MTQARKPTSIDMRGASGPARAVPTNQTKMLAARGTRHTGRCTKVRVPAHTRAGLTQVSPPPAAPERHRFGRCPVGDQTDANGPKVVRGGPPQERGRAFYLCPCARQKKCAKGCDKAAGGRQGQDIKVHGQYVSGIVLVNTNQNDRQTTNAGAMDDTAESPNTFRRATRGVGAFRP
jgi:hypothetical protein